MIEINLLPEELRKREVVRIALPDLPVKKTLLMAGGGILIVQIVATVMVVWLSAQSVLLKKEVAVLGESTQALQDLRKKSMVIQSRIDEFGKLGQRSFRWVEILNAITHSMTKGVWLRRLKVEEAIVEKETVAPPEEKKEDKPKKSSRRTPAKSKEVHTALKLEGSVVAPGQETAFIGKFLKSLNDNPVLNKAFDSIQVSSISQRKIKDYDVYDFLISCHFRPEKKA